ncbi:MAG: hypothetical protein NTX50_02465, partial [Candidatus Sumerlaeota bacterium]|nr:hypothetical protein [Candidatus Sumerlaeota bacterium]
YKNNARLSSGEEANDMQPHRGTLILILGILGIVACVPLGIAAWIMGSGDLKEMAAGRMDKSGYQHTYTGRVLGMIATIIAIIVILAALVLLALGGALFLYKVDRMPAQVHTSFDAPSEITKEYNLAGQPKSAQEIAPGAEISQNNPQTFYPGIDPQSFCARIIDKAVALRAEALTPGKTRSTGTIAVATGNPKEKGDYAWCEFTKELRNPDELIQAMQTEVEKEIGNINGVIGKRIPGANLQSGREKICYKPGRKYADVGGFCIEYGKDQTRCCVQLNLLKEQDGGANRYRLLICVSEPPPAQP